MSRPKRETMFSALADALAMLITGGSQGQVLRKKTASDYDVEWTNQNAEYIGNKPVDIPTFVGKDGCILAYDEFNDKIYLKLDEGGGGGETLSFTFELCDGFLTENFRFTASTIAG